MSESWFCGRMLSRIFLESMRAVICMFQSLDAEAACFPGISSKACGLKWSCIEIDSRWLYPRSPSIHMRCPYIIGRDSWVKGYIKVLASPFPPRSGGMIPFSYKHYHHDITSRLIGLLLLLLLLLLNVIVTYIYIMVGTSQVAKHFLPPLFLTDVSTKIQQLL